MNTKGLIGIDRVYLIRHQNDNGNYFSHDTYKKVKNAATRYLYQDYAVEKARQLHGEVEEEILTPKAMRLIIEAKAAPELPGGQAVRQILDRLCNTPIHADNLKCPTLEGQLAGSEEIIFIAVGRFADIMNAAHNIIESYYNLMSSNEYYRRYDPELDNYIGEKEYEVYYQLERIYEIQLVEFSIIYQAALEYLFSALLDRYDYSEKYIEMCNDFITAFSNAIILNYQTCPEKCFEQFLDIAKQYLRK